MPLLEFEALQEGVLIKRYKRFLADIEIDNGEVVTAHCANTGSMRGVLVPGQRVRLRHALSPKRKLAWTWEQAAVTGADGQLCWVGVNTALPNRLVRAAIEVGCLVDQLGDIKSIRAEVAYGENQCSRIDLLLTPAESNPDQRLVYLEVKNTTWVDGRTALFPDSVTKRGQKHLVQLMNVLPKARAILIPCLSRPDVNDFAPGDQADSCYGSLFRAAVSAGVEVIPCCFRYKSNKITWQGLKPIRHLDDLVSS
ncbi:DNA/RNA nuclease SfsA [Synechococcus sp. M16CYN]|uniref:DNA/RNA nuclease SfsA n=1 Tax=Synechococcus sp. M16CYN TaxID=3103139 RepID=UPI0032488CD4